MDDFLKDERFLARWLAGELNEQELTQFQQHPDFPKYQRLLQDTEQLPIPAIDEDALLKRIKAGQKPKTNPDHPITIQNQKEKSKSKFNIIRRVFIPAAAILFLISSYFMFFNGSKITTIQTAFSEQTEHQLPDQSSVVLNTNSSITYDGKSFSQQRSLTLSGEAFFEVSPGNSFIIQTEQGTIKVLGTSFTVFSKNGEFLVSCKTGKVQVENKSGQQKILTAGERVRITNQQLTDKEKIDTALIGTWQEGISKFKSEPFKNVITTLEQQFNIIIKIDPDLTKEKFTGAFLHKDVDKALKMVFAPMELKYEKQKEGLYRVYK